MADPVDARAVFVAIVERGSFRAAARHLDISLSYASRRLKQLEQQLGVQLLARTTRRVQPTPEGFAYYERLAPLLRGLAALDREVAEGDGRPRGVLRIAAPLSFGLSVVQPVVTDFLLRHPEVQIDLQLSDRRTDPLDFDVTVRGGQLGDSSLTGRRLLRMRGVVAASPDYLARRGTPTHLDHLDDHDAVEYSAFETLRGWQLGGHTARPTIRLRADSGDALVQAGIAGVGLVYQPDFLMQAALDDGRLVQLLPEAETFEAAFWALTPPGSRTAAASAFIDALVGACAA